MSAEPLEAATTTTDQAPTTRRLHLFSLGEVVRILAAAGIAGIAVGYLLQHHDSDSWKSVARILGAVAMTAVLLMIFDARRRFNIEDVRERLDRIEKRLGDQLDAELRGYARAYLDHKDRNG